MGVAQSSWYIRRAAARAYVLETGTIVMSGNAKDLLCDPRIRTAYLGE